LTIALPVVQIMLHAVGPWIRILEIPARVAGVALVGLAAIVFRAAMRQLGTSLVASPMPVPHASLRKTGVYAVIRHPIYAAILSGVMGWSWLWNSAADLLLAVLCVVFFLAKSRYEEGLLAQTFPEYGDYRRRVPGLIPRRRGHMP
jgi:protein-S-isoprenylcysteine O-methyltransferase Ste14